MSSLDPLTRSIYSPMVGNCRPESCELEKQGRRTRADNTAHPNRICLSLKVRSLFDKFCAINYLCAGGSITGTKQKFG